MDSLLRSPTRSDRSPAGRAFPRGPRKARPRRLALCLLGLAACGVTAASADIAVVVHPSVEVDDLSFSEFRKISLGDRKFWTSGERITLIVRAAEAPERNVLLERVYKMSEAQYRQYWVAKIFRAEATSDPRIARSNEEAVELVGVIEGAIALVSAGDVPRGLKILKINGLLPGEPGYPFN